MKASVLFLCMTIAGAAFAGQANTPKLAAPPPGFGPRMDVPPAKTEKKNAEKKPAEKKAAKEKAKTPAPAPKSEERTTGRAQRSAPAPVAAPKPGAYGPGQDLGDGFRACVPGDTTPAGAVKQGYRKIEATTPFGRSCRWEKADGAAAATAPPRMASNGPLPGVDVGGGHRGCASSESAAPGAVQNGYRKVVAQTPFGQTCRWEPVQASQAAVDYRSCAAGDASPTGTVRDGFRKVEAVTAAGKTCRWERTAAAQ